MTPDANSTQGQWLVKHEPEPMHTCPAPEEAEPRDVWQCECGQTYVWSDVRGYGFEWRRVILRKPFYQLLCGLRRGRQPSNPNGGGW